ncbi:MAG: M14 family metallopeptidase [Longimicrobiales bacterium]|nr:M14 family metallopeptidase [Longimicrobiales bacterium]
MSRRTLCLALLLLFIAPALTPAPVSAQDASRATIGAPPMEMAEGAPRYWTIPGERHGPSFFPFAEHPEVEYVAGDLLTFDTYHTADVMWEWMRRWAERYPDIVEIQGVGESFGGTPILQATITNKATGAHTDKPAAFFEGGRHSGEITSSESVLWLMQHLVESYGEDPEITRLIDTKTIYLRPQNNPDGSSMYLKTAQTNRSSVRPIDNDGDGLLDEDPANDLNGDGVITQIRRRPRPGEEATHRTDPRDPSGRLMERVEEGEEGEWIVEQEGLDDDGDGRRDEDGIGGLDLHRNYPENWRPDTGRDRTGRGYTQFGAGAWPLSEPETRSVVLWTLEHPNIAVANSMDTRVPMHLRGPSTSRSEESIFPEDLAIYEYFDSLGLSITGYPWAGDTYFDYRNRGDAPSDGSPREGSPLFGHGPDFGYFYLGAIWYGDELWDGGAVGDLNGDGEEDPLDRLQFLDDLGNSRGFMPWTRGPHPEYGEVEYGGFHPKFFSQNGPPHVLERWARNQALFNLQLALHLPELEVSDVVVEADGSDDEGRLFEIEVTYENVGGIPTALRQARLVKIVRPDRLELEFGEDAAVEIVDPAFDDKALHFETTAPDGPKRATFRVRVTGSAPVSGSVVLTSTRGGVATADFTLPGG